MKTHYVQETAKVAPSANVWIVRAFAPGKEEKKYTVRGATCDCDGFEARAAAGEVCKHVALVQRSQSTLAGKAVPRQKAREIYAKVAAALEEAVNQVTLDDLVRDAQGKVNLVRLSGEPKSPRPTTRILRAFVDGVKVEVTLR